MKAESASLGPAFVQHDPRVQRLAHESGLQLSPRTLRCFDEVKDLVDYDLVLVMDKFDFDEVSLLVLPAFPSDRVKCVCLRSHRH